MKIAPNSGGLRSQSSKNYLTIKSLKRTLPRTRRALLYFFIRIVIGLIYAKVAHAALMFGFINGIAITFFVGAFDVFLEETNTGNRIRSARDIFYFLVVLFVWSLLILMSFEGVTHLFARLGVYSGDPQRHQTLLTRQQ